jgi:hypothetical protein
MVRCLICEVEAVMASYREVFRDMRKMRKQLKIIIFTEASLLPSAIISYCSVTLTTFKWQHQLHPEKGQH